ncbi:DUF7133 domain-containing protein [Luteolibacter marinus]|uniref:DUF7133 domain-containing protein n=1 Tax=Luteolibacter marinus TaxID=2776705 RepID=UPI0018664BB3|nr:c-type cytochrome [Luteolibacter marinus]
MRFHALLLLFLAIPARGDIARWADGRIPVTDGLELWLDATRENEAREAHYMNRLENGQGMEIWHDSSGRSRHLVQWSAEARPSFRDGSAAFDGGDYLAALLTEPVAGKGFTAFLVTAPDRAGGDFPAILSAAKRGENDYTSGLNIDLGRAASGDGTAPFLNVEGAGQSGESNLLLAPLALPQGHLLTVTGAPGGTRLRADGVAQGRRDRGDVSMVLDRVAVGARFVEPEMHHFFQGRIAEVLLFSRSLGDDEIAAVEGWLQGKHAAFLRPADPDAPREVPLEPAKDAPVVQMFVPGFTVEELPVELSNLNNIEYAPDGRLFAAGYDGRFHVLRDTDGDGLEDRADTFSTATTDNYPLGLVVKDGMPHALLADELVRFRDTDGDGIPEKRETVLKGWDDPALQDDPNLMHRRVDSAMALAAGPDGSWYLTMGSANPGNGYWQKAEGDVWSPDAVKTGKPGYAPDKRRGCLLRISPDGQVEQLASGLRYIMSLQWDQHGELFATDQEGATWLPNGNPFDELLHLQTGRHYGFPPRHPELLPDVVDEPSVWDYAPQHQSTCGFRFNGPAQNRPRFGPEFWAHDAIVTGESRGKLWRTTLAKTPAGYVAANQLIARVGMLLMDCAISPQGDLVLCCHSGPPDWGSGPSGMGRLFKIRYAGSDAPQPVLAWAADETTTVVEFDRPLPRHTWADLAGRVHLETGRFVDAADRFETMRPGYAVVRAQQNAPRFRLPVKSAALGDDGRSLVITSPPRIIADPYAITLEVPRGEAGIPQAGAIDLVHTLGGLAASWQGEDGCSWSGWLPHPDPRVSEVLTRGSAFHAEARKLFAKPGTLKLRCQLDLSHLLQPSVQPGSKLDYTPEPEVATLSFDSDGRLKINGGDEGSITLTGDGLHPLEIEVTTPLTQLEATFVTAISRVPRPLGTGRFLLPFARPGDAALREATIPEIAGGDRGNGRALFHGKATCFTCHTMNGEGHAVGPDLSNTVHRDYASVLRDIEDPSATINPDAIAYQVSLVDGRSIVGVRVGETPDELRFAAPGGAVTTVKKSDLSSSTALPVSLMPPGLLGTLSPQEVKDLMSYLLTPSEP